MKGFHILPSVIDKDYKGEIKVMAHTVRNTVPVLSIARITQLVLVPTIKAGQVLSSEAQGARGFGSSDVLDTTNPVKRPKLTLWIEGKQFSGLLDTGADVSVIARQHWPHVLAHHSYYDRTAGARTGP